MRLESQVQLTDVVVRDSLGKANNLVMREDSTSLYRSSSSKAHRRKNDDAERQEGHDGRRTYELGGESSCVDLQSPLSRFVHLLNGIPRYSD